MRRILQARGQEEVEMARIIVTPVQSGMLAILIAAAVTPAVQGQRLLRRLESRLNALRNSGPTDPPATGAPYLGLVADNHPSGVEVLSVTAGGPAAQAGLRRGDIITTVQGRSVRSVEQMAAALRSVRAGQRVDVRLTRNGLRVAATVTPGRNVGRESLPTPGARTPTPAAGAAARVSLGVSVVPVTDTLRARYGLTVRRGALISSVRSGSAAAEGRLQAGSVIVALDGRRIDSPDQLIAAVQTLTPGKEVELTVNEGRQLIRRRVKPRLTDPPPGGTRLGVAPLGGAESGLSAGRPVLGALERLLGDVARREADAAAGGPLPPPPAGGAATPEVLELQTQVQSLTSLVKRLNDRIDALEKRIAGGAAGAAGTDARLRLEPPDKASDKPLDRASDKRPAGEPLPPGDASRQPDKRPTLTPPQVRPPAEDIDPEKPPMPQLR